MNTILNLVITALVCAVIIAVFLFQSSAGDARQIAKVTKRGRAKSKPTFDAPPPLPKARRRLRFDQAPPPGHTSAHRPHV